MSGGTFSKDARPTLAGSYFDFLTTSPVVAPAIGRIVAVGFTHNWGPLNVPTLCTSWQDFVARYRGDSASPTSGYNAVRLALMGDGDFGGASAVLACRMGVTGTAAKATKTLQNTTPANAIALSAKYEGTLGNSLKVTTQDYAADSSKNELILYLGTQEVERYRYVDTNIADLVSQINAASSWITASLTLDGVGLAIVTSQAFTAGNDGATLTATEYTNLEAALETQKFGALTFENLTSAPILASLLTWAQGRNAGGQRFFVGVGGALDETVATAITRSGTLNDENFINLGVGRVIDSNLLDVNKAPTVLSSAQAVPRIVGALAARGESFSLTFAKMPGWDILNAATASDIVKAYDGGVVVLDRTSSDATVRIAKGLTTYTTTTNSAKPKPIFSNPKFVATMQGLQSDLVAWADDNVIGKTTVDNESRNAVLSHINELLRVRELVGSIQPGWSAFVDPSPPPSDSDQFIAFVIQAKFGRSTEQVYFTGQLS